MISILLRCFNFILFYSSTHLEAYKKWGLYP
jgi:hypothetical protein